MSAFRAKFEKFEGGTTAPSTAGSRRKSLPGGQLPDKDKEKDGGANRALDDSLKLVKSLQTQITDLDKARESDRKELLQKLEQSKKQITEETKAIKDRNTQVSHPEHYTVWPVCLTDWLIDFSKQGHHAVQVGKSLYMGLGLNPLSPHDALKHHFTSLKTDLISLQQRILEPKFPWNWFTSTW